MSRLRVNSPTFWDEAPRTHRNEVWERKHLAFSGWDFPKIWGLFCKNSPLKPSQKHQDTLGFPMKKQGVFPKIPPNWPLKAIRKTPKTPRPALSFCWSATSCCCRCWIHCWASGASPEASTSRGKFWRVWCYKWNMYIIYIYIPRATAC